VIEAAKTWVLPIAGTSYELAWDGTLDMVSKDALHTVLRFPHAYGVLYSTDKLRILLDVCQDSP
jgi:hypothetical protein